MRREALLVRRLRIAITLAALSLTILLWGCSGAGAGGARDPPPTSNGTVRSHQRTGDTAGGFTGALDDYDYFGDGVASLGDLDGDSIADLAVGAIWDDDGGTTGQPDRGAVWVLFLEEAP